MPDEDGIQEFERQKWMDEKAFREREVVVKEREQRSAWKNPLVLGIIGGTVAAVGNLLVAYYNGKEERALEETRADSARILEMIKTGDADKAAENLRFLADAGLISDAQKLAAIRDFLAKRRPGQGPALPSAAIVAAQPTQPTAQIVGIWVGPIATFRNGLADTIDQGYKVQERWPQLIVADRAQLLQEFTKFRHMVDQSLNTLSRLRADYGQDKTIGDALAYDPDRLLEAIETFYNVLVSFSETLPPDYETKVVNYSGELRIQLKLLQQWHSNLQQAYNRAVPP